jgi:hypothetical protein
LRNLGWTKTRLKKKSAPFVQNSLPISQLWLLMYEVSGLLIDTG